MTETLRDAKLFEYLERIAVALEKMAKEEQDPDKPRVIGIRLD